MSGWRQVEALGFLSREEVFRLMLRSRVGLVILHPLKNYLNALPVKMFEHMAAGLPVIASAFPLWRQIIEKNHCGLCVDPFDSEQIAQAIQWIMEHPEEAKQMGGNGRKSVEERYNWEMEKQTLLTLYENIPSE